MSFPGVSSLCNWRSNADRANVKVCRPSISVERGCWARNAWMRLTASAASLCSFVAFQASVSKFERALWRSRKASTRGVRAVFEVYCKTPQRAENSGSLKRNDRNGRQV